MYIYMYTSTVVPFLAFIIRLFFHILPFPFNGTRVFHVSHSCKGGKTLHIYIYIYNEFINVKTLNEKKCNTHPRFVSPPLPRRGTEYHKTAVNL